MTKTTLTDGQDLYFLHARSAELTPADDSPSEVNGLPAKAFWAKGIKVGASYRAHSKKGPVSLSVQDASATQLLSNFDLMKQREIRVPMVADHKVTALNTLGHGLEAKRDGDWLKFKVLAVGQDAINAAARNEVSLGIHPNFIDGEGRKYGPAITHIALTPEPVVPGQGGLIAASRADGGDEPLVYQLSANSTTPERSNAMIDEKLRKRFMSAITGVSEDTTDDVLLSRIADEFEAQQKDINTLTDVYKLSRAEVETISAERDAAKAQIVTLSRQDDESKPDDSTLFLLSRSLQTEREAAIMSGGVSEAAAKKFDALLLEDGRPNAIALSRGSDEAEPLAFQIWNILRDNQPVKMGGRTGVQGRINLSREVPDATGGDPEARKKIQDRMTKVASGEAR